MFFISELYLKSLTTTLFQIVLNKSHCHLRDMYRLKVWVGRGRLELNLGLSSQKVGNLCKRQCCLLYSDRFSDQYSKSMDLNFQGIQQALSAKGTQCTHTDRGDNHARLQPARQKQLGLDVLLRDNSTLSQQEPGIELATFRSQVNPLYLLSLTDPMEDFSVWSGCL